MYIINHEKSTRTLILCSYEYVQLNQLKIPARSSHALLQNSVISHTKKFLRQPICQSIQSRSAFNAHQNILYKQAWSQDIPLHDSMLYTTLYGFIWSYNSAYEESFCTRLSPVQ